MSAAVTRIGDADENHCSVPHREEGSTDVFCNGIGISRQGDNNDSHQEPNGSDPCTPHSAPITTGSTTVFINGMGCGRIGDAITDCTSVAEGSSNVFAGG
jgi:uncharacterized Zn-binding protein involved in type VI secretion